MNENDASHEPRPFDCPDCGHHHKADLHAMVGHPEIHGKVPCAKCGKLIWLSLQEDGEPLVELYEEHLHAEAHGKRVADAMARREAASDVPAGTEEKSPAGAEPAPSASAGAGGSPMFGTLLAAAVVAALVSLLLGGLRGENTGSQDTGVKADPRVSELQKQVSESRTDSAAARAEASTISRTIADLETAMQKGLAELAAVPKGDVGADAAAAAKQAAMAQALEAVKAAYKSLNGRIEGNYVKLRQIDKRLEKVETPPAEGP